MPGFADSSFPVGIEVLDLVSVRFPRYLKESVRSMTVPSTDKGGTRGLLLLKETSISLVLLLLRTRFSCLHVSVQLTMASSYYFSPIPFLSHIPQITRSSAYLITLTHSASLQIPDTYRQNRYGLITDPGGSVISPYLFCLYVSGICSEAECVKVIKYADDLVICGMCDKNGIGEKQYEDALRFTADS